MSLARFSIIVATDSLGGIAKKEIIPWENSPGAKSDMRYFRDTTIGRGNNVVIMGRKTYETIPPEHRPLANRTNVVISTKMNADHYPNLIIYRSFSEALCGIGLKCKNKDFENVFVIGGESIYNLAIEKYLYLCDKIYVTKFRDAYGCDQFFPLDEISNRGWPCEDVKSTDYIRYTYKPNVVHEETAYLKLLNKVLVEGVSRSNRTSVASLSLFGEKVEYDISESIPLLTTKAMSTDNLLHELLFMIAGKTQTKDLEELGNMWWKKNTSEKFLKSRGLNYDEGDMGPSYWFQARHWNAEYTHGYDVYDDSGIDQLRNLIDGLRNEPMSRRHVMNLWNPSVLDKVALPPCAWACQFYVTTDRKLDCMLIQRSGDMFVGVPYNIAFYAVFTYMVAHVCGYRPRKLIHVIGDAHIYTCHIDNVKRQLERTPKPLPRLLFRNPNTLKELDDFTFDDFEFYEYEYHPYLKGEMVE